MAERFGRVVESLGRGRSISPESIHRAHRQAIRLRVVLAVRARADPPSEFDLPRFDDGLRRVGRWLGRVRNVDVSMTVLERAYETVADPRTERIWRRTHRDLRRAAGRRREQLAKRMAGRRANQVAHRTRVAVRGIRRISPPTWSAAWWTEWEAVLGEIRGTMRDVRRKASMRKLHRLRIALRRARMLHRAGERTAITGLPALPPRWVELARTIGRVHDLKIAIRRIPAPDRRRWAWARTLAAERDRLRAELLGRIGRDSDVARRSPRPPLSQPVGGTPGGPRFEHVGPLAQAAA
ncbi:MAG TPA: hypothetical protein VFF67_02820 [Thermoplasmata archaeon]|nr:hypothetical protein [Thermoplasmata archaeon]